MPNLSQIKLEHMLVFLQNQKDTHWDGDNIAAGHKVALKQKF